MIIAAMRASTILRHARKKANLSQRELARRAGTTQATISRIEDGLISPRVDTLERLLEACGFQLEATPRRGEGVDRGAIRELLRSTPAQRARLAVREARNLERLGPPGAAR
jgi:transcriptional regulator with XRE-family HTH domain